MKKILKFVFILIFANTISAQVEPNDCVNALTVCGNGTFFSNADGIGNVQEVNSCGGFESNSLWLKITIAQAGTLGFDLIPDDQDKAVDYDFWVFAANSTCSALGSPIRCNTINPLAAQNLDNHTGMNGTAIVAQAGPGAGTPTNHSGYVRWLTVSPGQSYYIAIDRPEGDGGFQIQWTGTATAGTGAFPPVPVANTIANVLTCSNTPNVGLFDFNTVRPLINADATSNTITFHATTADAIDNVNPLPNAYPNTTNPQTICARVTNNTTGCYSTSCFNLVVNLVPNASVNVSNSAICPGDSTTVTFSGTPNATFDYTVDGGSIQTAVLNTSGIFTITESPVSDRVYKLTGVRMLDNLGATICSQPLNQSVNITINALPTATILGTPAVCMGNTATIAFNGTPNANVTYTVDGGSNQNIMLDISGNASITTPALTVDSTYNLVSATAAGTPACSQNLNGSATIMVKDMPTAAISGSTTICSGNTAVISFNGTPDATVTYNDGGGNQTIFLDAAGAASFTTSALTADSTYNLVSVTTAGTPACSQILTDFVTITVTSSPTASISGTTTICSGNTAVITFNGTPNATVIYTINGGSNQNINLDVTGTASFTTPALTADSTYELVSVTIGGTSPCSQNLIGSAIVSVIALPTANISGTIAVCPGSNAVITFNGTPNATVTYNTGGINQTILLNSAGSATINTPALTASITYNLVSVTTAGIPACSKNLNGSAAITVNALPTASISGTATICSGDTANITFNGTPNAIVTYTVNGSSQTIALDVTGTASITTSALTTNSVYNLVSVAAGTPACSQAQNGSATITVIALPTAAISGTASVCVDSPIPSITFTGSNGTAPYTFTYSLNGVIQPTIASVTGNFVSIPVTSGAGTYAYSLISVQGSGPGACSQPQSGTATVTISPLSNATITASSPSACLNSLLTVTLSGSSGSAPYTFVYTENGTSHTVTSTGNSYVINVPTNVVGPVNYTLLSVNDTKGCSQNINQTVTATVLVAPIVNTPPPYALCDDGANCFDLTGVVVPQVTTDPTLNVTFHLTSADAQTGVSPQASPYCTNNSTTLYIRVYDPNAPACYATKTVQLVVNQNPVVTLESGHICVDPVTGTLTGNPYRIETGLSTTAYTFMWFNQDGQIPSTSNSFYNASVPGQYFVQVTHNGTGCSTVSNTATVVPSSPPQQIGYTSSSYFAENAQVVITAEPAGNYEYQLDNGPFQQSNVFGNIAPGLHTIRVQDVFGCDVLEETFRIIDYPKFFTPNGDGYNDLWNISLFEIGASAQIRIFDRYGKVITVINTNALGWDGLYNGQPLPSTDYWFTIFYTEESQEKEFSAHFSLKR
jgi:gliding motility-associated-like protein